VCCSVSKCVAAHADTASLELSVCCSVSQCVAAHADTAAVVLANVAAASLVEVAEGRGKLGSA